MSDPIFRPLVDEDLEKRKELASILADQEHEKDRKKTAIIAYLESCLRSGVKIVVSDDMKSLGMEQLALEYTFKQGQMKRLNHLMSGDDSDYGDRRTMTLNDAYD